MALRHTQALGIMNERKLLHVLAVAFGLGGLIGFERQYRQRMAGLRTNVLVAVGAAVRNLSHLLTQFGQLFLWSHFALLGAVASL